jgi:hypothetical protein
MSLMDASEPAGVLVAAGARLAFGNDWVGIHLMNGSR